MSGTDSERDPGVVLDAPISVWSSRQPEKPLACPWEWEHGACGPEETRVKSNDVEAFDAFVRARYTELLRYGRALIGTVEEGADLVQDALERTLRAWPRLRSREDPEGYVRRTMVNRHINTIRRRRREPAMQPPGWTPPEADRAVWEAIRLLPPRQRAVIAMRYFEDLSVTEIAERLGISEGTVKSQAAKAKEHLRVLLGSDQEVADG